MVTDNEVSERERLTCVVTDNEVFMLQVVPQQEVAMAAGISQCVIAPDCALEWS